MSLCKEIMCSNNEFFSILAPFTQTIQKFNFNVQYVIKVYLCWLQDRAQEENLSPFFVIKKN